MAFPSSSPVYIATLHDCHLGKMDYQWRSLQFWELAADNISFRPSYSSKWKVTSTPVSPPGYGPRRSVALQALVAVEGSTCASADTTVTISLGDLGRTARDHCAAKSPTAGWVRTLLLVHVFERHLPMSASCRANREHPCSGSGHTRNHAGVSGRSEEVRSFLQAEHCSAKIWLSSEAITLHTTTQ